MTGFWNLVFPKKRYLSLHPKHKKGLQYGYESADEDLLSQPNHQLVSDGKWVTGRSSVGSVSLRDRGQGSGAFPRNVRGDQDVKGEYKIPKRRDYDEDQRISKSYNDYDGDGRSSISPYNFVNTRDDINTNLFKHQVNETVRILRYIVHTTISELIETDPVEGLIISMSTTYTLKPDGDVSLDLSFLKEYQNTQFLCYSDMDVIENKERLVCVYYVMRERLQRKHLTMFNLREKLNKISVLDLSTHHKVLQGDLDVVQKAILKKILQHVKFVIDKSIMLKIRPTISELLSIVDTTTWQTFNTCSDIYHPHDINKISPEQEREEDGIVQNVCERSSSRKDIIKEILSCIQCELDRFIMNQDDPRNISGFPSKIMRYLTDLQVYCLW
ncbi:TPA_asm: protein 5 [Primula virus 1]|uniref:Protein 5 n=1 Tax=Primula virus 1 TaxID=2977982 RepID=A0A9N6YJI3_9RHAB|nr:TPA_asm: protein 5 [Primula virus 1]